MREPCLVSASWRTSIGIAQRSACTVNPTVAPSTQLKATDAIGDVQGCYAALQCPIQHVQIDPRGDRLWFVGDLVNRGPNSLSVLRYIKKLENRAVAVLGNHDLFLLAIAAGHGKLHDEDTLHAILDAPDKSMLLDWLRRQKLVHRENGWLMVHAGLLPQWSADDAERLAQEVEKRLQRDDYRDFLAHMYGNKPQRWDEALHGKDRLRLIVNAMTRMRLVTRDGDIDLKFKGELDNAPPELVAWFDAAGRRSADTPIVCGHWSALGLKLSANLCALDSGCLWGGDLTALRLEDRQVLQVSCREAAGTRRWQ